MSQVGIQGTKTEAYIYWSYPKRLRFSDPWFLQNSVIKKYIDISLFNFSSLCLTINL